MLRSEVKDLQSEKKKLKNEVTDLAKFGICSKVGKKIELE